MKRLLRSKIYLLGIVMLLVLPIVSVNAQAESTNQDLRAQRCTRAQHYLKSTLGPRDLRVRVDRLQIYQYLYQRLDGFVKRLEYNQQPLATELRAQLDQLNQATITFKADYEIYNEAREQLVRLGNCQGAIDEFQKRLDFARSTRQDVQQDVITIEQTITATQNQLNSLYTQLLATGTSGGNSQ